MLRNPRAASRFSSSSKVGKGPASCVFIVVLLVIFVLSLRLALQEDDQSQGAQSLGAQSLGAQSLGVQSLGVQSPHSGLDRPVHSSSIERKANHNSEAAKVPPVLPQWAKSPVAVRTSKVADAEHDKKPHIWCNTSNLGPFEIELFPDLAPNSVERILKMVRLGFFNLEPVPFFRVNQWITQFAALTKSSYRETLPNSNIGLNGEDPWAELKGERPGDTHPSGVGDDEESQKARKDHPWVRGHVANLGSTQLLIVRKANANMGTAKHDSPAGMVTFGMETVFDQLFAYDDIIDNKNGKGPDQRKVMNEGYRYIQRDFPKTDAITWCEEGSLHVAL